MIIKVGGGLEPLGPIGVYAYGQKELFSILCYIILDPGFYANHIRLLHYGKYYFAQNTWPTK